MSASQQKEKNVFATRVDVGAIARDGVFGNSQDTGISCGSEDNKDTIDSGLHETERLG